MTSTKDTSSDLFLIHALPDFLHKPLEIAYEKGVVNEKDLKELCETENYPEDSYKDLLELLPDLDIAIVEVDENAETFAREYFEEEDDDLSDKKSGKIESDIEEESSLTSREEAYRHQAKERESFEVGASTDNFQTYLKTIRYVDLLTREGEVAIAQRIEAGQILMLEGLCTSPMTIETYLKWYQKLQNEEFQLRDIINLELMHSKSEPEMAGEGDDEGDIDGTDLSDDEDEDENEDSSFETVSIAAMERDLLPDITEIFENLTETFVGYKKVQKRRLLTHLKGTPFSPNSEKTYQKYKNEIASL
ncbi:MAG: hypothetical protein JXR30_01580, partial [Alphaproteobacteria bacterium]|nr:hypothetical protein [Alphaproteobacteria bacterium]